MTAIDRGARGLVSRSGAALLLALWATPTFAARMIQNNSVGRVTAGSSVACDAPGGFAHWNQPVIPWLLNTGGQGAGKQGALQNALASWTNVGGAEHHLVYAGTTGTGWSTDGINTVLWARGNGCTGLCLALTAVVLEPGQVIVEADITFNTDSTWSTDGTDFDTEAVAAHEFGHTLGIHHTEITTTPRPTMYATYFGTDGRSLEADDRAALQCAQRRLLNGQVHYWSMSGGARTGGFDIATPVGGEWNVKGVGDVNGDGTDDVVWQHRSGQVNYWSMGGGARTGGFDISTPVGAEWNLEGVGDVNGDGTDDVVWQHRNGQVNYWSMSGGARTGGFDISTPVAAVWNLKGAGDVDGDGTEDLLWQYASGDATADLIWQHDGGQTNFWPIQNGVRTDGINILTPIGSEWNVRGSGDVDGDGTADLVWQRADGQVHYWRMENGQMTAGFDINTPVGGAWHLRAVGDVDGDHTADIVWQHDSGQVHYWSMDNGRVTGGFDINTPVGGEWHLRAAGDVDGDNTADIVWQHDNGQVNYWSMDNGQVTRGFNLHVPVGGEWHLRAVGDVR